MPSSVGRPLWTSHSGYLKTIADGCRLEALGDPNFEMFMKYVEKDVFTVVGRRMPGSAFMNMINYNRSMDK